MPYILFHSICPDVAERETRVFIVPPGRELPADEYALTEMYCDERGCDCRRVFFSVVSRKRKDILAVVAYGWEERSYYAGWLGSDRPEDLDALMGPCLNDTSRQSELAPGILRMVKLVLQDDAYVERLKRHYVMFRQRVNRGLAPGSGRGPASRTDAIRPKQGNGDGRAGGTARNAPCPCGSGKKYKRCCGREQV